MIELLNLHIGYSSVLAKTEKISLEKGKVYALFGANGKGKSTLLKTLSGRINTLSGTVNLEGKSITSLSNVEIAKKIAYVQSRFEGADNLSVKEYISLGRTPYLGFTGSMKKEDLEVVESSIEKMGIQHLSDKFTNQISDGERQIASITRALVQQTPIIFLDEPTAFLDYTNKMKALTSLITIAQEENKCILISTHDIDLCFRYSTEKIIITKNNAIKHPSTITYEELIEECF